MTNTGIVILAAGNSSRLGTPKQLLIHKAKGLLQHVVDEALTAKLYPVVVVLGFDAANILQGFSHSSVHVVINPNWKNGMASSIAAGISKAVSVDANIESCILAVCDQPFLTAEIFQQLLNEKEKTQKGIVACSYGDSMGTPVLFHRHYFKSMSQLKGEEGAKKVLRQNEGDVCLVPFAQGIIDIDTTKDYEALQNV